MHERLMDRCPATIRQHLGPDRPFIMTARNSQARGASGRRQAAQNVHVLANSLYDDRVADFRDLLPSQDLLEEWLEDSEDRVESEEGAWRFVEWRTPDRQLMLVVAQGSGTKVDGQDLQVFMERLRATISTLRPVAVWTHEADRLGRDEVGMIRLVRAIERNKRDGFPCEIGYARRGTVSQHDSWDIPVFFEARQARIQAQSLYRRTRDAQRQQTERSMKDGRFRFPLATALPPGLGCVRLLDARGGMGFPCAYLDSPTFRPAADEVAEPLHICLTDTGDEADQVANVQWALAEMANERPAMSIARILAGRGFSSVGIARNHSRGATYRSIHGDVDARVASSICRSITRSLEFYETGVLRRHVGGEIVEVADCAPPGGWLTADVSRGVRDWIARRSVTRSKLSAAPALTGMQVTFDGNPYRLIYSNRHCSCQSGADHA